MNITITTLTEVCVDVPKGHIDNPCLMSLIDRFSEIPIKWSHEDHIGKLKLTFQGHSIAGQSIVNETRHNVTEWLSIYFPKRISEF